MLDCLDPCFQRQRSRSRDIVAACSCIPDAALRSSSSSSPRPPPSPSQHLQILSSWVALFRPHRVFRDPWDRWRLFPPALPRRCPCGAASCTRREHCGATVLLTAVVRCGVLLFSCCLVLCPLAPCQAFRFLSFLSYYHFAFLSFIVLSLPLSNYRNSFCTVLSCRYRTVIPKLSVRYLTQNDDKIFTRRLCACPCPRYQ